MLQFLKNLKFKIQNQLDFTIYHQGNQSQNCKKTYKRYIHKVLIVEMQLLCSTKCREGRGDSRNVT